MKFEIIALVLISASLAGCSGDTGPVGPSGPQGSTGGQATAQYYYQNNFDTATNLNEWTLFVTGGQGLTVSLDTSSFHSPSTSMKVSITAAGPVFTDSMVYMALPIDTSKDLWVEFDWLLDGAQLFQQIAFDINGTTRMSIGYNASSTSVFLTNGVSRVNVRSNPVLADWHHVKMVYNDATGKSSYWWDEVLVGENYQTNEVHSTGGPVTGLFGFKNPAGNIANSITHVDNLECYYY